ncbi:hypothetical protein [Sphaerisporangium album]|uniref:hypothetical protein n=1 Tax=Sphaerisporangium album TaxID=509200 RepID=UPI0011C03239|nr:hypothetical protein [Sphaerisporangium album]
MKIDPAYARRVAERNAGRSQITEEEITTAGVAELAQVNSGTVRRWANNPHNQFPARLRHGVYPLQPVLEFLKRRQLPQEISDPETTGEDALLSLYDFARLNGLAPKSVYQYADHPYLTGLRDPDNVDHKGVQRWRRADLDHFWHEVRPSPGMPRGRPDPLRGEVLKLARQATPGEPLTEVTVAKLLKVPLARARRLLAAASLADADPHLDPLLDEAARLALRVEKNNAPLTAVVVAERLQIPVARAQRLLAAIRDPAFGKTAE